MSTGVPLRGLANEALKSLTPIPTEFLIWVVEPEVRRFCGPLFFTTSLKTPRGHVWSNGTFGLVDTGQRKLLVTCQHVWADFKKKRLEKPDLRFAVCLDAPTPLAIDVDAMFVDEDKRCDLATFDMDEDLQSVCAAGRLEFFNLHANRPPQIKVGDVVYMIGFPGKGRLDEVSAIGFPRQPIGVQATEVGRSHFFGSVASLKLKADDFGGISGCPCFQVRDGMPSRLVGFATDYSEMTKMLQFTYARYIRPDGVIDYMR